MARAVSSTNQVLPPACTQSGRPTRRRISLAVYLTLEGTYASRFRRFAPVCSAASKKLCSPFCLLIVSSAPFFFRCGPGGLRIPQCKPLHKVAFTVPPCPAVYPICMFWTGRIEQAVPFFPADLFSRPSCPAACGCGVAKRHEKITARVLFFMDKPFIMKLIWIAARFGKRREFSCFRQRAVAGLPVRARRIFRRCNLPKAAAGRGSPAAGRGVFARPERHARTEPVPSPNQCAVLTERL